MREKLIDLISGGVPRHEPFLSKVFEGLADHLIANGVRLEEKQATKASDGFLLLSGCRKTWMIVF